MRLRSLFFAALIPFGIATALALSIPVPAEAQLFFGLSFGRNMSQGDCNALAARMGPGKVWYSRFSGAQPDPWDRGLWHAWGVGCFATYKECKTWLYNTQTEYPRLMDFTFCKQGLPQQRR